MESLLNLWRWLLGLPEVCQGVPRHPRWDEVSRDFLAAHPICAACGRDHGQVAHHIYPVSWPGGKDTELDPGNLIALGEEGSVNCHILFGHLGDWASRNSSVVEDAAYFLEKIMNRPYSKKKVE